MSLELKKYCLNMAAANNWNLMAVQEVYNWLSEAGSRTGEGAGVAGVVDPSPSAGAPDLAPIMRTWNPRQLTSMEKIILRECIRRHREDEKISGTLLNEHFKKTGSSAYLNALVGYGYMRREGNKYRPVRLLDGSPMPPIKTILPAAPARGYKPLTQNIKIGRAPV